MNTRTTHRGIVAIVVIAALAVIGQPGPARAAARYDFAVGAGIGARYWQTSQWNPGTCTIDVDYGAAKSEPNLNKIDAVVLSPADLGIAGRLGVPMSWGATQQPPTGGKLLVRFVYFGQGCPHQDLTFTASSFAINVPANARFMVVSAAEGTAQPWFTI